MTDLAKLTFADFAAHTGTPLIADFDDVGRVELEIAGAEQHATGASPIDAASGIRSPFSVTFKGPAEPALPQGMYRFSHPQLGTLEIFITLIGNSPDTGATYEAVFT